MYPNSLRRKRATRTAGFFFSLVLASAGCRFSFDRSLSPGEIRGTVVMAPSPGSSLSPVAGARVSLENSSLGVTTDARGSFVLTQLPAGTYSLDITAPQPQAGVVPQGLHIGNLTLAPVSSTLGSGRDLGQVELGAYGGIAGTVTSQSEPLNGAFVVLPELATTRTVAGAYAFSNLLPGNYALTVVATAAPGAARIAAPVSVTVQPRAVARVPDIDVPLRPVETQGGIAGRVVLLGASSSKGVTVTLGGTSTRVQPSDDAGDYAQTGIPAYVYTVTASAPGYMAAIVQGIIVGGPTTNVPIITLAPGTNPPAPQATIGGSFSSRSADYHMVMVAGRAQQAEQSSVYKLVPNQVALSPADGGSL